jgi:hypothetical protein
VKAALASLGRVPDPETWSPWRSYAQMHLWRSLGGAGNGPAGGPAEAIAEMKEMI